MSKWILLWVTGFAVLFGGLPQTALVHALHAEESTAAADDDWRQPILAALAKKVTLKATEKPLADVMQQLGQQAGLSDVLFDLRSIEDIGVGTDTPITRNLEGSLETVLKFLLKDLDLTWVLRDGALVITSVVEAEYELSTRVFHVADLLQPDVTGFAGGYDYDLLIELITSIVAPTSWVEVGGAGSIEGFRGTLVLSQTRDILAEVQELLDALREARKLVADLGMKAPAEASLTATPELDPAVGTALGRKGDFKFVEEPLSDVAVRISELAGVPIMLDARAMDDVGLGSDTPITFTASGLTVSQALKHILPELDLTHLAQDHFLLITTPEEAETRLQTRIYPVVDLVAGTRPAFGGEEGPLGRWDYDSLTELVTSIIAPTTWVDAGGAGNIVPLPPFGVFAISQTAEVHGKMEDLFGKLRKTISQQEAAAAQAEDESEDGLRLVVYLVMTKSAVDPAAAGNAATNAGTATTPQPNKDVLPQQGLGPSHMMFFAGGQMTAFEDGELLELIQELVAPESWDQEGVFARAAAGRLIIRQTDEVHRQIRRLLTRLNVPFVDAAEMQRMMQSGMGGMGMGGGGMGGMGGGGGGFF